GLLDLQEAPFHPLSPGVGDRDGRPDGLVRSVEDVLDAVRRLDRLIGEAPDLARDDGEALSVLPRADRLDRGVEGEHVRLVGEVLDGLRDASDLGGPLVELTDAARDLVELGAYVGQPAETQLDRALAGPPDGVGLL